jgi:uroporphyrinogen-III synthase
MAGNLVLTRPAGSNAQLQAALRQAGVRTFEAPLIEIKPINSGLDIEVPLACVIFTSQNAVAHAPEVIARLRKASEAVVFAVGTATKQKLAGEQISALAPIQPGSEFLLQLEELQQVKGKTIMVVTGRAGRGLIETELAERGARVMRYECYQRLPLDPPELERRLKGGEFDHVLVTSVDVLTALMGCLRQSLYSKITLVVTAARIAEVASKKGFKQLIQARGAGVAEVLEAVTDVGPVGEMHEHQ